MLQIIVVYFAPYYMFRMKMGPSYRFPAVIIAFVINYAFTISIAEMFTVAKQIGAAQTSVMPLLAAGIFYYVFNLIVATVMEYIEKRLSYYR